MVGHDVAARWLRYMGAAEECVLPRYGKDGEDFILFSWTDKSIWIIHEQWVRRKLRPTNNDRSDENVLLRVKQATETTGDTPCAVSA